MDRTGSAPAGAPVTVEVESRQDGRLAERKTHAGKLYDKAGALYLRYEEPAEAGGRIGTTLRWDGRELRLARGGAVESVQTFAPGKRTPGAYRSALDRKSTRLNSSHIQKSRMPSSA